MPEVTVLMAVHNGERFVRDTIESVLAQTFDDFEFLIMNDGSTDGTEEIIRAFRDSRIRLVNNGANLGLSRSLNRGIGMSSAPLIARQDADDLSLPSRLSKQMDFMKANPSHAVVGSWYAEIDERGVVSAVRQLPVRNVDVAWALNFYCPFAHSAVMLRKSDLERVGGYDVRLRYSMDYELWVRLASVKAVANLDEALIQLRHHPTSMTATYGRQSKEGHAIRVQLMAEFLNWNDEDAAYFESRFGRLFAWAVGERPAETPEEAARLARQLLRLQSITCRFYRVGRKEARAHRRALRASLAWEFLHAARRRGSLNRDGVSLVTRAARTHPPVMLTPKFGETLGSLLPRSPLLTPRREPIPS